MKRILICYKSIENIERIINCDDISAVSLFDDEELHINMKTGEGYVVNPSQTERLMESIDNLLAMKTYTSLAIIEGE